MDAERWVALVSATIGIVILVLAGCTADGSAIPTPTPVPPTPTRLEREEDELINAWHDARDGHGALLRRGIRVTVPMSPPDRGDNSYASPECSPAYPVIGIKYGVYYVPSDELYRGTWTNLYQGVCFASEEDAVRAGYQRGPH